MKEEFKRGRDLMYSWGDLTQPGATMPTLEQWEELFEPADFFIDRSPHSCYGVNWKVNGNLWLRPVCSVWVACTCLPAWCLHG